MGELIKVARLSEMPPGTCRHVEAGGQTVAVCNVEGTIYVIGGECTSLESLAKVCDVVTLNCPLYPETEHTINENTLKNFKRGAYLINTARGKLCDRDAIVSALESGQLAGYAGDVWFPQPPPADHPWRQMPNHGMTPHMSGSSLNAQTRYAAGTREIIECYFEGRPIRDEYLIVQGGKLAGAGAHSYSEGNATKGSEEAERFKT